MHIIILKGELGMNEMWVWVSVLLPCHRDQEMFVTQRPRNIYKLQQFAVFAVIIYKFL